MKAPPPSVANAFALAITMAFAVAFTPINTSAACVQAGQADQFVDSIGVNIHISFLDYTSWTSVMPMITNLGVRHVRTYNMSTTDSTGNTELLQLAAAGVYTDMGVQTFKSDGKTLDPTQLSALLTAYAALSYSGTNMLTAIESIEGPNEDDANGDPNWALDDAGFMQTLTQVMQGISAYNNIPILGPSVAITNNLYDLPNMVSGTYGQIVDIGNAHPYNGNASPYFNINPEGSAISSYLRYAQNTYPGIPLDETENGYSTVNSTAGVSETQQAIWEPRILLENYRLGINRTFLYDLLDEDIVTSTADWEHHYGLVKLTGTSPSNTFVNKMAYGVIQNLITILTDKGSTFTPGYFSYALSASNTTLHELTLQKRNGVFYLALWLADTGTGSVSQGETVTFAQPVSSVSQYIPYNSASETPLTISGGDAVSVTVTDIPIILAVTQTAGGWANAGETDYLANLSKTYSSVDWTTGTPLPSPEDNWGDASVAYRNTDTTTNSIVYYYPNLNGFEGVFGFASAGTLPINVTWSLASYVTFYTSVDGTTWNSIATHSGPLDKTEADTSGAGARWFQSLCPSVVVPAGQNYLKMAVTTTTGNVQQPFLAEMDLSKAGSTGLSLTDQDIGSPTASGTATYTSGIWTVVGAGTGLTNGDSDQFNYAFTSNSGTTCTIIADCTSNNGGTYAQSGVMLRSTTAANSIQASLVVTPGNGITFYWRGTTGGGSADKNITGITTPIWLKLTQSGTSISAYYSSNGSSWTQVGSTESITFPNPVLAGIAVDSHSSTSTATATFTNVSVGP